MLSYFLHTFARISGHRHRCWAASGRAGDECSPATGTRTSTASTQSNAVAKAPWSSSGHPSGGTIGHCQCVSSIDFHLSKIPTATSTCSTASANWLVLMFSLRTSQSSASCREKSANKLNVLSTQLKECYIGMERHLLTDVCICVSLQSSDSVNSAPGCYSSKIALRMISI